MTRDCIISACQLSVNDIIETVALNTLNVLKNRRRFVPQLLKLHLPGRITAIPSDRVHNQHGGRSSGARHSLRPERRLLA